MSVGQLPPARMGHSAVLFGEDLVIFGGRISPAQPLNDVWALHLPTCAWRSVQCKGSPPPARFRHTAVAYTDGAQACFESSLGMHSAPDCTAMVFTG